MIIEKEVEVISITRAIESVTGNYIYQVTFGQIVGIDDELRKSIPIPPNSKPPKKIATNVFSIFIDSTNALPYKAGSKWKLKIGDSGNISVNKI